MSLYYRHQGHVLIVFGNTYPVREQIKSLGGTFNGPERNWRMPFSESALARLDELCRRQGGGPLGGSAGPLPDGEATQDPAAALKLTTQPPSPGLSPRAPMEGSSLASPESTAISQGVTVSQLMARAAGVLQAAFPEAIWITAEVQNLAVRPSGLFFELAEGRDESHANATVTVKAILWRGAAEMIAARRGADAMRDVLQDGLKVRMLCRVQLYKDRGQLSLLVEDIDPTYTKGALAMAREKLLKELRAKGLDRAQKRLTLSPFPFRVGLVSAKGSRAQSDFLDQLFALKFPGHVVFCPTPMQGESVPTQVVQALRRLEKAGCDVIVMTRGGGSAADLRWFDAAEIAYAIAGSKVPIVAAIGHHDDVAVAEEICFERQKTPTAAADFVAATFEKTRQKIDILAADMAQDLGRRVEEFSLLTATLGERLYVAAARGMSNKELSLTQKAHGLERQAIEVVQRLDGRFQVMMTALTLNAREALNRASEHLSQRERDLTRRDPSPWLEQGWTQLSGGRGMIRRTADIAADEELKARLLDGRITLKVVQVESVTPPDRASVQTSKS